MTPAQHRIYQDLLAGAYIVERPHPDRGRMFKLYKGNADPIRWVKDSEYKAFTFVMRKEKRTNRLVLDRRAVRRLHGKTTLKKLYREQLQKMDAHRRCANIKVEGVAPHSYGNIF